MAGCNLKKKKKERENKEKEKLITINPGNRDKARVWGN